MKQIFITLSLIVCLVMASCSSDESANIQTPDIQKAYDELNQQIASYNTEFRNQYSLPPTTKAWKFWKRLAAVLSADASGALVGSIGGPCGSIFCAVFFSAVGGPAAEFTETRSVSSLELNSYATLSDEGIGYLHNTILSEIEAEHPGIYNQSTSYDTMANLIVEKMKKYGYTISTNERNQFVRKAQTIIPQESFDTADALVAHYQKKIPEFSNQIGVVLDFVSNVGEISDETELVRIYNEGYQKIVSESNLPDPQKKTLLPCIDVAANSAILWEVE